MIFKISIISIIIILFSFPLVTAIGATYFSNGGVESTTAVFPDTANLTISFWIKINDSAGDGVSMVLLSDGAGFSTLQRADNNFLRLLSLEDPAGVIVDGSPTVNSLVNANTNGWLHVLMAISTDSNIQTTPFDAFRVYFNDTNQTPLTDGVVQVDTLMNWNSSPGYTIGSNQVGTQPTIACLAEVWIDNVFLDLDDVNVRRNFIGADGGAIEIGGDGSSVTGSQPLIYFTGDTFSVNNGTLDDPDNINGVQTECEEGPPESIEVSSVQVNVSIINPFDGSFQGALVFVNYTFSITSPSIFVNATLLINGTFNQTQSAHNNFTVIFPDGNFEITINVTSNSTESGAATNSIIVDTINPFDNLNTIIPDGSEIFNPTNFTIIATNANLILHNITVYDLSGNQLLSQQDTGILGTTNDITINLDSSFFASNAPGTFNITSFEQDNVSLTGQTSSLLTIVPPTIISLVCDGAVCSNKLRGDTLSAATLTCDNVSQQSNSFILKVNNTAVITDGVADTINDNLYHFNNSYTFSSGDHNATAVCTGINGQSSTTTLWTINDFPASVTVAGFAAFEAGSGSLFTLVTSILLVVVIGASLFAGIKFKGGL